MPLHFFDKQETRAIGIWKIEEDEATLSSLLSFKEEVPANITHSHKRLEHLAARVVATHLLTHFNKEYKGIIKNEHGKPFLVDHTFHISQSHSYPYVGIIIDTLQPVGIDIEKPRENLRRVAGRVFNDLEIDTAGNDLRKLCLLWSAKETLIKLYGQKDLELKTELLIDSFVMQSTGEMNGTINRKNHQATHVLHYQVEKDHVVVYNKYQQH